MVGVDKGNEHVDEGYKLVERYSDGVGLGDVDAEDGVVDEVEIHRACPCSSLPCVGCDYPYSPYPCPSRSFHLAYH